MAEYLGLEVYQADHCMGTVNDITKQIKVISNVKVGEWGGQISIMVMHLNDFMMILGNNFFQIAEATMMPHLGGIFIQSPSAPCFVKGVRNVSLYDMRRD